MYKIKEFHAHIYFDKSTEGKAYELRNDFHRQCDESLTTVGLPHPEPVGPHTKPMFTIAFNSSILLNVITYLMLNRNGLDVLIHPFTDDEMKDHTDHAMWIGKPVDLDLSKL